MIEQLTKLVTSRAAGHAMQGTDGAPASSARPAMPRAAARQSAPSTSRRRVAWRGVVEGQADLHEGHADLRYIETWDHGPAGNADTGEEARAEAHGQRRQQARRERGGVAWHMSVPGVAWRRMRLASRRGLPSADSQGRGWSLKETDGGGGAGGQAAGGAGGCGLGEGAADGPQVGGGGEPGGLLLHALTCVRP